MSRAKDFPIKYPTEEEVLVVNKAREDLISKFRNTPREGVDVEYLGKVFRVFPTVFWPHDDSKPLVQNFRINNDESVLDVCTGSGLIAIHAALAGASKVIALDINPEAIRTVRLNAEKFKVDHIIDARVSDVYSALNEDEIFDIITCNPPFSNQTATDVSAGTVRDTNLNVHKRLFNEVGKHLKPGGRMYISQANFGNIDDMLILAESVGLKAKLIGEYSKDGDPRIFYAFELHF